MPQTEDWPKSAYRNGPRVDEAFFRQTFGPPDVGAEVPAIPAVRLTRDQWAQIKTMIVALAEIADTGRPVEATLIRGAVLAEAVSAANDLRRDLRLNGGAA